jgi:hypothetical protein
MEVGIRPMDYEIPTTVKSTRKADLTLGIAPWAEILNLPF